MGPKMRLPLVSFWKFGALAVRRAQLPTASPIKEKIQWRPALFPRQQT
jgi:hypothetical protein